MNPCGLLVLLEIIIVVDARVYCQDSHASPWRPLGYTCPVVCQNIVNAIERLKLIDFEKIISQKNSEEQQKDPHTNDELNLNVVDTSDELTDQFIHRRKNFENDITADKRRNNFENDITTDKRRNNVENDITADQRRNNVENYTTVHNKRNNVKDYDITADQRRNNVENYKTNANNRRNNVEIGTNEMNSIDEKQLYKDVIKLSRIAAKTFTGMCSGESKLLAKLKKCARKSNYDGSFLKIMTNMLNKYVKSNYLFTDDMTEVLLEKILGKNTDLRNSILDVNTLLQYLRQAILAHQRHARGDVISLRPQRCFTVALPGCFCAAGFVENFGQCVKPSDCVDESVHGAYLARVIVL